MKTGKNYKSFHDQYQSFRRKLVQTLSVSNNMQVRMQTRMDEIKHYLTS